MDLKPVISQFILLNHQLTIILRHKKIPFRGYGLMLNLKVKHQNEQIALINKPLTDRTLGVSLLDFGEFVLNDEEEVLDFGQLGDQSGPFVVLADVR